MTFNFTNTTEVGTTRTRAKKVIVNYDNSITYELENKIIMKDGTNQFFDIGTMIASLETDKDINKVSIETGEVLGTESLLTIKEDMRTKANYLVSYFDKDKSFIKTTEAGTSYNEIKNITIVNKYKEAPLVTFLFNEVLVLADGKEMRLENDRLEISLKMDITKIDLVTTLLELNQDLFNIMVDKSNNLTEDDLTWLV